MTCWGRLSVFGFLTAYALVAVALPFARRALGQHSHTVAAVSVLTVVVMVLIAIFDLRSTSDADSRADSVHLSRIYRGGDRMVRVAAQTGCRSLLT